MTKNIEVVSFGELLWDVLPTGAVLGGAPANFALRVAALGRETALVSRLGRDALGEKASLELEALGVSTRYLQWDERMPTGTVDVSLDQKGNASYVINPSVAYDFIVSTDALVQAFSVAKIVCFGTLIQRSAVSKNTLYDLLEVAPKTIKLADINLRRDCYTIETLTKTLQLCNVLKLNSDEVGVVCKMLSKPELEPRYFSDWMISEYGIDYCLITKGAEGVYAASKNGEIVDLPGYKVNVIDTIGSGDAFTAGFVDKLLSGSSLYDCCSYGNKYGAVVATKKGGMSKCSAEEILEIV